jgi:C4-dicarboxylate transporter
MGPELHIITILVICMLLAAMLEFVRGFNTKTSFPDWKSPTAAWLMPSPAW